MTTVRGLVSNRRISAELIRSSLEYMLTRWLQRKEERGVSWVLRMSAWTARPSREERVETADSNKEPSRFGEAAFMDMVIGKQSTFFSARFGFLVYHFKFPSWRYLSKHRFILILLS